MSGQPQAGAGAPEGAWVLAIDLGTSGPKVAAVEVSGQVRATAFRPVATTMTDEGASLQDVAQWWVGIREGVAELRAQGACGGPIVAVATTGQWASTVPVDSDGAPVGPCLMWSDRRGADLTKHTIGGPVLGYSPTALLRGLRVNCGVPLLSGEGIGHELYLRHRQPDVYRRTATLLEPVDYLGARLTGVVAATPASMAFSWVIDTRRGKPRRYDSGLLHRYRRDPRRLPALRPTGARLAGLATEPAQDLGLPAGTPVFCGIPDLHAAHLGSGRTDPNQAHLAISTTSWVSCRVPGRRVDPVHLIGTINGLDDRSFLLANDQPAAGACLSWWAERVGESSYDALLAPTAAVPPGCRGIAFLPWLRGEHTPLNDPHVRGGFLGLGMDTDVPTMTRAVLEGVAANGMLMLTAVERLTRTRFTDVRLLGGGAQSDVWCQIYADVLDRPVHRVADPRSAQLRGAALLATVGLGQRSLSEAAALVPVDRAFEPNPGAAATMAATVRRLRQAYRGARRFSVTR